MPVATSEVVVPATRKKKRTKWITFDKLNRRTHLYVSMFFMPWVLVYGLSSAVFNHPQWFRGGPPKTESIIDRQYDPGPVPDADNMDAFAEKIQKETGLTGQYIARRNQGSIFLVRPSFWSSTQIKYDPEDHHLVVKRTRSNWSNVLTSMHTRGGFNRPGFLPILWSVIVDIVQVSIIIWIASGLFMWWNLKRLRNWGWVAIGAGGVSFALFLLRL